MAYIILMSLLRMQCFFIARAKAKLSKTFRTADTIKKITHVLEVVNLPAIFGDWDDGDHSSKVYLKRFKEAQKEMLALVMIQYVFNMFLLSPILVTGE